MAGKSTLQAGQKMILRNRRAFHDYAIASRVEAGMVLVGTEVKSLREGRVSFQDAWAEIRNGEVFLISCHISPYSHGNQFNHDPLRQRKLLLHKDEIRKLNIKVTERGFTLIPLSLYFSNGRVKVELGLGKGKRAYDKRHALKEQQLKRDMRVEAKERG